MKRGVYNKSLSHYILLALEKSVDGYVYFDDFIHHPLWERPVKKSELAQALKRLRESGWVSEDRVDTNKVIFKLTEEGRDIMGSENEKWDGKYRIVIFDIPEQKRLIRDLFRRNLKKWGFKHLQKSVWISKRDVYQKLSNYVHDLGIEKWVVII